jgi:hypothetical protein
MQQEDTSFLLQAPFVVVFFNLFFCFQCVVSFFHNHIDSYNMHQYSSQRDAASFHLIPLR